MKLIHKLKRTVSNFDGKLALSTEKALDTVIEYAFEIVTKKKSEKTSFSLKNSFEFSGEHFSAYGVFQANFFYRKVGEKREEKICLEVKVNKLGEFFFAEKKEVVNSYDYKIDYYDCKSKITFVVFNGAHSDKKATPFGLHFLIERKINVVACLQNKNQYQNLSFLEFKKYVDPLCKGKDVFLYGSSLGGYCAIYYAGAVDGTVIAASPRNSSHPEMLKKYKTDIRFKINCNHVSFLENKLSSKPIYIFLDPFVERDVFFLEQFIKPAYKIINVIECPHAGHELLYHLNGTQQLAGIFHEIVFSDKKQKNLVIDKNLESRYSDLAKSIFFSRKKDYKEAIFFAKKSLAYLDTPLKLQEKLEKNLLRIIREEKLSFNKQPVFSGDKLKKKEVIIHIGMEKTATSTLQRFLASNRQAFINESVLYPACAGKHGGSQWEFVAAVGRNPWSKEIDHALDISSEEDRNTFYDKLKKLLDLEITNNKDCEKILISSEHFHSRLIDKNNIALLKDMFEAYASIFKVVCYIRRQDRVAVSSFSTKIKSGQFAPHLFPPENRYELNYYYDYLSIYENWSSVFGEKNVNFFIFEDVIKENKLGGILKHFTDFCGLSLESKKIPPRENESLSAFSADLMLTANNWLERKEISPVYYRFLVEKLENNSLGKFAPCTKSMALGFLGKFENSNKVLKEKVFPKKSSLFDINFESYTDDSEDYICRDFLNALLAAIKLISVESKDKNEITILDHDNVFDKKLILDGLYRGILDREPDFEGKVYWEKFIEENNNLVDVIQFFLNSDEFVRKMNATN